MSDVRIGMLAGYPRDGAALQAAVRRSVWAEEEGLDFMGLGERIIWRNPHLDAWITAATIFAHTSRIKMGFVYLVPLRQPILASKLITSLDHASNGRLLLFPGIGGDYPREYRNCGVPVEERVGRTDEALTVLKKLWTGEPVTFDGTYYHLDRAVAQPLPVQPGGPPMWLSHRGRSMRAVRRSVDLCDGWLGAWVSPDRFKRTVEDTNRYAESVGRDPATLAHGIILRIVVGDSREEAVQRAAKWRSEMYGHAEEPSLMEHLLPLGTPEQCAERVAAFVEAGATHIMVSSPLPEPEWDEQLPRITREVLPRAGIQLTAGVAA